MKRLTILSAVCYLFLLSQISFAQKTASQYYQAAKDFEQKSKFTKAFKQYQTAADLGLAAAQISVASFYETGLGGEESAKKAFKMYQKAALQNELFAQYKVARSYETGRGVQKNIPKAIAQYLILWEKSYPKATFSLKNLNVDQTSDKNHFAYTHYKAAQGIAKYEYKLGQEYVKKKDFENAQLYLEKAAQKKYTPAQSLLANLYFEGSKLKKNKYRAVKYYVQAANQGDKEAEIKAKQCNLDLWLLPKNIDYLIFKARNGDAFSQFALCQIYLKGEQITQNKELAFKYCEQAALQEHQEAIEQITEMYQKGIGTEKNSLKYIVYLLKSAKLGLPKAQHQVGDYYLKNKKYTICIKFYLEASNAKYVKSEIKIEQNPFLLDYADQKSKDYLVFKAQKGEAKSQYLLARHYFDEGERVGLKWLFKAAEQGNQNANLLLAEVYVKGEKLPKDIKKACELFAKAELGGLQVDGKYKDICANTKQIVKK